MMFEVAELPDVPASGRLRAVDGYRVVRGGDS